MGHHGAKLRELERPAGAVETGAATAYDPMIGAAQVRSTYGVQGTGMTVAVIDTGVDYNNPASVVDSGLAIRSSPAMISRTTPPIRWRSTHNTAHPSPG